MIRLNILRQSAPLKKKSVFSNKVKYVIFSIIIVAILIDFSFSPMDTNEIDPYSLIGFEKVLITQAAVEKVEEWLS